MLFRWILRVLWVRRLFIAIPLLGCMAGGLYVTLTSPPRYAATARVVLDYLKPDPITGRTINGKMVQAYVNSQMRAIRDYQTAIPAAEAVGLLNNLELQSTFAASPLAGEQDFSHWVADRLIAGTAVRQFEDSNILEISSTSATPGLAIQFVDAIRSAYVQASIDGKRQSAASGADALTEDARKATAELAALEDAKAALSGKSGVMPLADSRRLTEMVTDIRGFTIERQAEIPTAPKLAAVEAAITETGKAVGPNHPQLKGLEATRDMLRRQVDAEKAAAAAVGSSAGSVERARQAAIEAQKQKVLSQRQLQLQLQLIQDQIDAHHESLDALNKDIAAMRQLTTLQNAGLTPMGEPEVKTDPVFPNPLLIMGGTAFLGLGMGLLLAFSVELLNRRLRMPAELEMAVGAPLIGVTPRLRDRTRRKPRPAGRGLRARLQLKPAAS